jgi:hypothetical protein
MMGENIETIRFSLVNTFLVTADGGVVLIDIGLPGQIDI